MHLGLPVRLATSDDADCIAYLSRDLIEHGMSWGWRPERVREAIAAKNTNVAVIGPIGVPVAFGIMEYRESDAHLLLFAVAVDQQRKGLGTTLLLWLEQVARAAGVERVEVEARRQNVAARSFYNEHGYHEWSLERQMYSATLDGVRLEKWLRLVTPEARSSGA